MLCCVKTELKQYFDGDFDPDTSVDVEETQKIEKEFTKFLYDNCRCAFSTEEAYTEFEEQIYSFCGRLQIPAMEAAFEKGVACGRYLKEKE